MRTKRLLGCLAVGVAVVALAMGLQSLVSVPGILLFPGMLIASIAYPEGIHTGSGSWVYIPVFLVCDVLIYGAAAYWVLSVRERRRARAK